MCAEKRTVAVLGASANPERYSNRAVRELLEKEFEVIPVNPGAQTVYGLKCSRSLREIERYVDILTVYVNPGLSAKIAEQIFELNPGKVIFNPGTENPDLMKSCTERNIGVEQACTLVLLRTGSL